jgi:putative tryptophan/tyrosine transport system substrate-binding protein
MRRREFITFLGAAAWPLAARAQQSAIPVVGFLHIATAGPYAPMLAEFRAGLGEAGYVEGQNVAIEYRWADNEGDRLPALAEDLVRRRVAVIVAAGGTRPALAAKGATSTIPIVLAFGVDPVGLGLVASLNRPGGNVTGVTFITAELEPKRLEFLTELVPQAKTVGYLNIDPRFSTTAKQQASDIRAAARVLGREVVVLEAGSDRDFEGAFATFVERRVRALVVGTSPLFTSNRHKLLALAARHRIPAIYHLREFVVDGGLMSYGASIPGVFRQAGTYVGQILKGAKPADLPVRQSTHFELVINLKTAKSLGLTVPPMLFARANEAIE